MTRQAIYMLPHASSQLTGCPSHSLQRNSTYYPSCQTINQLAGATTWWLRVTCIWKASDAKDVTGCDAYMYWAWARKPCQDSNIGLQWAGALLAQHLMGLVWKS